MLSDIDTREGLEMLHRRHIDLVLLDLHMLRVNGLDVLRQVCAAVGAHLDRRRGATRTESGGSRWFEVFEKRQK